MLSADMLAPVSALVLDPAAFRDDRVLVRLEDGEAIPAVSPSDRWETIDAATNLYAVYLAEDQDIDQAIGQLAILDDVLYAQPDYQLQLMKAPNDPLLNSLYAVDNQGGADIGALEAWQIRHDAEDIIVGVIDTGVDFRHEDLAANIWRNTDELAGNGRDDDGNGFVDDVLGWDFANNDNNPQDDNGHGTHVAGTIGAVGDNGLGVAGLAWNVKIMPLKFMDANGSGYVSDAISALDYARENGARIVNNSWNGVGYSQALEEAISRYEAGGGIFVAAAGNETNNNDLSPSYPASFTQSNVITVAASDKLDRLADFSNYGPASVDIAAPGERILSTLPGDRYGYMSGTSMAAPQVSGALALIWAEHPTWTAAQVQRKLLDSADPVLTKYVEAGRLNVGAALTSATQPKTQAAASLQQQWVGSDPATLTGVRLTFPGVQTATQFDAGSGASSAPAASFRCSACAR